MPGSGGRHTADPTAVLQHKQAFWQTFWTDEENHEHLDQKITEAQQAAKHTATQKLDGSQLLQAMKNYSNKKSHGADHWSPAELKALPEQLADKLADVLN